MCVCVCVCVCVHVREKDRDGVPVDMCVSRDEGTVVQECDISSTNRLHIGGK
jgi:hypothetical protein